MASALKYNNGIRQSNNCMYANAFLETIDLALKWFEKTH